MNIKRIMVLILAIMIGSGAGILHYYLSLGRQKTTVELINNDDTIILLSVSINGQSYKFLWDTGASNSLISSRIAEKAGLKPTSAYSNVYALSSKEKERCYFSQKATMKIGDIKINQPFLIDSTMSICWEGILGSDIINQYHWLLDFEKRTVLISKKKQQIVLQKQEKQYDMGLFFKLKIPFCKIILNDTIQQSFLLDSGLGGVLAANKGEKLCHDLSFKFSDKNNMKEVIKYLKEQNITNTEECYYYIAGKEHKGIVFHDLSINGYNTKSLYATVDFDAYNRLHNKLEYGKDLIGKIYITSNFLRRFKKMYYSPQDKQVSFISSPDYNGYTGVEIDQFLHTFEKTGVEKVNKE